MGAISEKPELFAQALIFVGSGRKDWPFTA